MTKYTAKDITILEGLDPVRKHPGMYIGSVGTAGLHHLVWEIFDNAVDEAMNGYASEISVTLHKDGKSITVNDNGRGVPVDKHPIHKKSALEIIFSTLHAGGKFENQNYKTAGGLHGVGASVVNALSIKLVATVKRDGAQYEMEFKSGKVVGPLKKLGAARGSGTTVFFRPDPQVFPKIDFSAELIGSRLKIASFLHKGLKITFDDETSATKTVYHHAEGISDYLKQVVAERQAGVVHEAPFVLLRENGTRIELVLQWTEATDEHLRSYANGIPTGSGGTHEAGLRSGLVKAVRNFIETHKLAPRGVSLGAEDIREGLVGILSVFVPDPQFQGQTKDRLNNPEIQALVDGTVRPALEQWLNSNRTLAEQIVARVILAARAREASRAASAAVSRKTATSGRLISYRASSATAAAIFESGPSSSSSKENPQEVPPNKAEIATTKPCCPSEARCSIPNPWRSLRCSTTRKLPTWLPRWAAAWVRISTLSRLRYQRVILLADADSDGHRITTLLLTFFYRHLKELIRQKRVYVGVPPLYRVDIGKETYWAADDADKARIVARHGKGNAKVEITRFKGLGEMMPKTLWQTTLDPQTRRLLRVQISDELETDRIINELMGKDPAARFNFIMERAEQAQEIDV